MLYNEICYGVVKISQKNTAKPADLYRGMILKVRSKWHVVRLLACSQWAQINCTISETDCELIR
jgi:hypothetical protein